MPKVKVTSRGNLSRIQTAAGKRRANLVNDDQEDAEMREAASVARRPVRSNLNYSRLGRLQPIGRLCWTPTMPFPPMLETTLEEKEVFAYHPWAMNTPAAGAYPSALATTDQECHVGRIICNEFDFGGILQNIHPTVRYTSFPYDSSVSIGSAANRPDYGTPYAKEFFRHYEYALITGCRMAISVQSVDQMKEAVEYVLVVKKHTLTEEAGQHPTSPNDWNFCVQPTRTKFGTLNYGNYAGENKGSFLERARLFQEHIITAPVEVPAPGVRGDPTTVIHDYWSLKADEGVSLADILMTRVMKNDESAVGGTVNDGDAVFETDIWCHRQDDPAVATFTKPVANPAWYWWIQPQEKEINWNSVAVKSTVDDVAPTLTGVVAQASPCFNVTIKRQYDVVYFGHRLNKDFGRQEDGASI